MNKTITLRRSGLCLVILFVWQQVSSQTLADQLRFADTRNTSTTPASYNKNLVTSFKLSSKIGLPSVGYNFTALFGFRGWGDYTGGKAFEMGFIDNGRVYTRMGTTSSWEGWRRFIIEDETGSVGDLNSTFLSLMPLDVLTPSGLPSGMTLNSNTGYWEHQARGFIGLQKRSFTATGTGNDITDKVGISLKGYYTEYGGALPIYLGGSQSSCVMTVGSDGRVSIGTFSTSTGFKLFVEEGIRTRKIKVDQSTWADYVFNQNYQLPSLKELDEFIQRNKRLPDMPSAEDVAKNGIDLGENQVALLKKIEELTLYIIAQEKLIQTQNQQIQTIANLVSDLKSELTQIKNRQNSN